MRPYRRIHRTIVGRVPAVVTDGYRRCAFEQCGKCIPDEASDNQKYCNKTCNDRARRLRALAS